MRQSLILITAGTTLLGSFVFATAAFGATFTATLRVGSSSESVKALQMILNADSATQVATSGVGSPGNESSYFGPATKRAVINFQNKYALDILTPAGLTSGNGFVGALTIAKLNAIQAGTASTTTTKPVPSATSQGGLIMNGLPVRFKIPTLKIDAAVQYAGLTADGAVDSPTNIEDVGWYKIGPRPGEVGSAVITGHFAQIRRGILMKHGVFNNLGDLKKGDKIYIETDKGESISFVVRETRFYNPDADTSDIFTSTDGIHLNLVTCDGIWDQAKLSYTKRLVVFTDLVL